jgi:hypothetical protein
MEQNRFLTGFADTLFDGDDGLFKELLVEAKTYAEYGCGASTAWVFKHCECHILSVDSSEIWLQNVQASCGDSPRLGLHFADVGTVGDWGWPLNYDKHENFGDYTDWIWQQALTPDIVLVDGRFRVCCFLTALLHARQGTRIMFDDYTNRAHYHIVERFLKPVQTCARQALFVVPNRSELDVKEVAAFIDRFRFVFE